MRVGTRQEEELVDEDREPVRVSLRDPEVVLARRRERALGRVEGHLEIAAERGERSPQLVGRGRDELVLQVVELEEALVLRARLGDEALHHQTGDRGDGREDEGAAEARRRIARRSHQPERDELGDRHCEQDRGELTPSGRDGEPEDREQQKAAESGAGSARSLAQERDERDVANRDPDGGDAREVRRGEAEPEQGAREQPCSRDLAEVERAGRHEEQRVRRGDCDRREREQLRRRLGLRACVGASRARSGPRTRR